LLVCEALVHGKEDVKVGGFRSLKQVAILQSSKACLTSGLAVVSVERVAKPFIDTLVEQNAD